MKILLTGATGFLGHQLLNDLARQDHQIIVTSRSNRNKKNQFLTQSNPKITVWQIEKQGIRNFFLTNPGIEAVIHTATDYGDEQILPTNVFWSNEVFPVELLENAMDFNVGKFINIDTFFNDRKINYQYREAYTLSKRHFQEWGELCAAQAKINFINLRLFHCFGPNDNPKKFVPNLIYKCLNNESIDLTCGEQKRDFIYSADVVRAVNTILNVDLSLGYHHYDVGRGEAIRLKDFIIMINEICNNSGTLNFGRLPTRYGEPMDVCANIEPLKQLGWSPKISLFEGLQTIVNDLKRSPLK